MLKQPPQPRDNKEVGKMYEGRLEACIPSMEGPRNESQVERLGRQIRDAENRLAELRLLKEKLEKNPEILEILNLMRSVGL